MKQQKTQSTAIKKIRSTKRDSQPAKFKHTLPTILFVVIEFIRQAEAASSLYNINSKPISKQLTEIECRASTINFYAVWFKETPTPLSFKIDQSKLGSAKEFILDSGGASKKYALYEAGNDCHYHTIPGTTANKYMFVVVMENDGLSAKGCKVSGVITTKGLTVCAPPNQDLLEAANGPLRPKTASDSPASQTSFSKIQFDETLFRRTVTYKPILFTISGGLTLASIDDRVVEMILLTHIAPKEMSRPVAMVDYDVFNQINRYRGLGQNEMIFEVKPEDATKRMVYDDLPGYFVDVYSRNNSAGAPKDDASKILARNLNLAGLKGIQIQFYIQKPGMIAVGETHTFEFLSQNMATAPSQAHDLKTTDYLIEVSRTATHLEFNIQREGTPVTALTISKAYTGGSKFIYFNLNINRGILYYHSASSVRAKTYETLHVYEVGQEVQRTEASFEEDLTPEEATGLKDGVFETSPSLYCTLEYRAPEGQTSNKAVFKVMTFDVLDGVYPPFLIADIRTANYPTRCYYPLASRNTCLSLAHLSDASETQTLSYVDQMRVAGTMDGAMAERCRVPFNGTKCYTPMPGFVTNLEIALRSGLPYGGILAIGEYQALDQRRKGFAFEMTSNQGTKYLITCPNSCGKCGANLKCTECLDGASVLSTGLCPTTSCGSIQFCGKCDTGGKCALCFGRKLQPDQSSCDPTCPANSGFAAPGLDYECLTCASNTKCKRCSAQYDSCEECVDPTHKLMSVDYKDRLPAGKTFIGKRDCFDPAEIKDYFYIDGNEFKPCKENCKRCTSATDCQECGSYQNPSVTYYFLYNSNPIQCVVTQSTLEITERTFSDAPPKVRLVFNKKVDSRALPSNIHLELTKNTEQKVETKITSVELEESKKALKIYFEAKSSGVEDGKLVVVFNEPNLISAQGDTSAPLTKDKVEFEESVSYYRPDSQITAAKTVSVASSYTIGVIGVISLVFSYRSILDIIKTFQMLEFLVYYNVSHPSNLQTFLEYLELVIIEHLPNPFEKLQDKLCSVEREKFEEDGITCYIISDLGQYLALTLGIFLYSMLLRLGHWLFKRKFLKEHIEKNFGLAFWIDFLEAIRFDVFLAVVLTIGKIESMEGDFLTKFAVNVIFSVILGGLILVVIVYQFLDIRKAYMINKRNERATRKEMGKMMLEKDEEKPSKDKDSQPQKLVKDKPIREGGRGRQNEIRPLKPTLKSMSEAAQDQKETESDAQKQAENSSENDKEEGEEATSMFSEDYKTDFFYQRNNRPLMAIKELTIIFTVVALYYYPIAQTISITTILTIFVCLDYYYKPMDDPYDNIDLLFTNTVFLLTSASLSYLSFTESIISRKLTFYMVGYIAIFFICLLIVKDLVLTVSGIYKGVKEFLSKKKENQVQAKTIEKNQKTAKNEKIENLGERVDTEEPEVRMMISHPTEEDQLDDKNLEEEKMDSVYSEERDEEEEEKEPEMEGKDGGEEEKEPENEGKLRKNQPEEKEKKFTKSKTEKVGKGLGWELPEALKQSDDRPEARMFFRDFMPEKKRLAQSASLNWQQHEK